MNQSVSSVEAKYSGEPCCHYERYLEEQEL